MTDNEKQKILIIDDEENMRLVLKTLLEREGYEVAEAGDGAAGLDKLDRQVFDYILCDVRMPVMDGMTFLAETIARGLLAPVIMLSAYGSADSALEATKAGAFDYVFKPFNPDDILLTLKQAGERERLRKENIALRQANSKLHRAGIVARSSSMMELLSLVERIAQADSPVLITGESGTGKELVARAIHEAGPRADRLFVAINCGAIPANLLESELFGHLKGAFTDAVRDRIGMFEEADGGTLFLDEVGELPLALQVKLLRAIQEQEIRPVGSSRSIKIDARIVAATARDLSQEIESGQFREDLYYRLNVLPLSIPPLRERMEDIPLLLDHFLAAHSVKMSRSRPSLAADAAEALCQYPWPGNVRELENLIERILVLCPEPNLGLDEIPGHIKEERPAAPVKATYDENMSLKEHVHELEARVIEDALLKCDGNRSSVARMLKISYPSLLSKIKTYGLG